jgi:hypothetical protein
MGIEASNAGIYSAIEKYVINDPKCMMCMYVYGRVYKPSRSNKLDVNGAIAPANIPLQMDPSVAHVQSWRFAIRSKHIILL